MFPITFILYLFTMFEEISRKKSLSSLSVSKLLIKKPENFSEYIRPCGTFGKL